MEKATPLLSILFQICALLRTNKHWTSAWDNEAKVPYAYGDDQWVGYDNEEGIKYKVASAPRRHRTTRVFKCKCKNKNRFGQQNMWKAFVWDFLYLMIDICRCFFKQVELIKSAGYGGAMIWAVNNDDANALCNTKVKYPLLTAISAQLNGNESRERASQTSETSSALTSTTLYVITIITTSDLCKAKKFYYSWEKRVQYIHESNRHSTLLYIKRSELTIVKKI